MSRRLIFVSIITLIALSSITFFPFHSTPPHPTAIPDSTVSIRLSFVGDLMCHSPLFQAAQVSADSFNFVPFFSEMQPYFSKADILFGNLETVTSSSKRYTGYPFFNVPADYIVALKKVGFHFLFTSNNHCLDQGEDGVLHTLSRIRELGIQSTGTFSSQHDRDSVRLIDCKGIKIAALSYSYGTNHNAIPRGKKFLVNIIDTVLMHRDISNAKSLHPDIILTYLHFGEEYKREPNAFQKRIVAFLKAEGVQLIIASHPHVIEPIEVFRTENENFPFGVTAYSLGNFLSNQQWRYSDAGLILSLNIQKSSTGRITVFQPEATATWVFKGTINNEKTFKILPSSDTAKFSFLSPEEKGKMLQSYHDTKELLLKNTTLLSFTK